MTTTSRHPYSETVARLRDTITGAGNTVFAVIDQAEAAASVGSSLRPTTLILFGNPKGGTPLMQAYPLLALDLPLKLLVWEESGTVNVSYVPASVIAARYGVTGMDERIAAMDEGLAKLAKSVA